MLPGLDGRKMSKSYDNIIALFAPPEQIRKQIAGIVTDSRAPGEPKQVEGSALFQIYQAFASAEETQALRAAYDSGIAWGDAKQLLFERIDREIAPMRERHDALVNNPVELEKILRNGAEKARVLAKPFLGELRAAVGLRSLAARSDTAGKARTAKAVLPSFKQYREGGRHYFKLVDGGGRLLAQSAGFDSPQQAGRLISQLKSKGLAGLEAGLEIAEGVAPGEVSAALELLSQPR
jgi:tryptophanyl-tRNA synthetase